MLCACSQSGPVRKEVQTLSPPEKQTCESPRGFLNPTDPPSWWDKEKQPRESSRGFLGIIHDDPATKARGDGIVVKVVMPKTACGKMRVLPGDVIIRINQQNIHTMEDLENARNSISAGDTFTMEIQRKDQKILLKGEMGGIPIGHGDVFPDKKSQSPNADGDVGAPGNGQTPGLGRKP